MKRSSEIPSRSLSPEAGIMSVPSHTLEQTTVHGPKSAGSAVDQAGKDLATVVDTSGGEEPAPQDMTKGCAFRGPPLPCLPLSAASRRFDATVDPTDARNTDNQIAV